MIKSKLEHVRHADHHILVKAVVESRNLPGRNSLLEFLDFFQRMALVNGFSDDAAKEIASVFFKKFIEEFGGLQIYIPVASLFLGDFVFKQLLDEYKKGEVSVRYIARKMGCSDSQVYKKIREMNISPTDKRLNQEQANLERWKKEKL